MRTWRSHLNHQTSPTISLRNMSSVTPMRHPSRGIAYLSIRWDDGITDYKDPSPRYMTILDDHHVRMPPNPGNQVSFTINIDSERICNRCDTACGLLHPHHPEISGVTAHMVASPHEVRTRWQSSFTIIGSVGLDLLTGFNSGGDCQCDCCGSLFACSLCGIALVLRWV